MVLVVNPAAGSGTGARVIDAGAPRSSPTPRSSNSVRTTTPKPSCARPPSAPRCSASAVATAPWRALPPWPWIPAGRSRSSRPARSTTSPRTSVVTPRPRPSGRSAQAALSCVDLVCLNDARMIVNTASIGAYPRFVQTRERLEHKIGKPLAAAYAMLHTLAPRAAGAHPLRQQDAPDVVVLSGQLDLSAFGLRASRRTRMDDGLLDVASSRRVAD